MGSCHGTVEGENCHAAVMWAMEHGIVVNPECYPDLYQGSSWAEFQLHLHRMGVADCAEPVHTCQKSKPGDRCYEAVARHIEQNITNLPEGQNWTAGATFQEVQMHLHVAGHIGGCYNPCPGCHTALPSETCCAGVIWAMEHGIHTQPDQYCDLNANSDFVDFQECLHQQKAHGCPMPCRKCGKPVEWDSCYNATIWAKEKGILIYPQWFPTLTPQSSFDDFQEFLHADGLHEHKYGFRACLEPCRIYSHIRLLTLLIVPKCGISRGAQQEPGTALGL